MLAPSWAVGTDKQAQGCAGEGLNPEGISPDSPRLRARMLAVTCEMSLFESIILGRLHLYIGIVRGAALTIVNLTNEPHSKTVDNG